MLFRCAKEEKLRRFISSSYFWGSYVCCLGIFCNLFFFCSVQKFQIKEGKGEKIKVRVTFWCGGVIKNCGLYLEIPEYHHKFHAVHFCPHHDFIFLFSFFAHTLQHTECDTSSFFLTLEKILRLLIAHTTIILKYG